MKKAKKIIVITLIVLSLMLGYQLFHYDNRYFVQSTTYTDYKPLNDYEQTYPVTDYVDERMDASAILRSGMIGSMARYDEFVSDGNDLFAKMKIMTKIFAERSTYIRFTQKNQYVETEPITLKYVGEAYDHNFKYTGVLSDGTEVTGNLAIWGNASNVSTAISFQDKNGNIDPQKAALFTDDSNAEMMAYLMIEAIQDYFGTDYEPNEAAMKFFNCTMENVAGSISYHAATSLDSLEVPMGELTIEKVKTANISTIDVDGFLVNQAY